MGTQVPLWTRRFLYFSDRDKDYRLSTDESERHIADFSKTSVQNHMLEVDENTVLGVCDKAGHPGAGQPAAARMVYSRPHEYDHRQHESDACHRLMRRAGVRHQAGNLGSRRRFSAEPRRARAEHAGSENRVRRQ